MKNRQTKGQAMTQKDDDLSDLFDDDYKKLQNEIHNASLRIVEMVEGLNAEFKGLGIEVIRTMIDKLNNKYNVEPLEIAEMAAVGYLEWVGK